VGYHLAQLQVGGASALSNASQMVTSWRWNINRNSINFGRNGLNLRNIGF